MRINQWLALSLGVSRRAADHLLKEGVVTLNGEIATIGQNVSDNDELNYNGQTLSLPAYRYVMLNKPIGYVCSRAAQTKAKTIYELLPPDMAALKSVGRLDKDSSGLLILTNDGVLAQQLTHPKYAKNKTYEVMLDRVLNGLDARRITEGVMLDDGKSAFKLVGAGKNWTATLSEGRNRQIRRTFAALGYRVEKLRRTSFHKLALGSLPTGQTREIQAEDIE